VCHEFSCGGILRNRAWSDKPLAADKRITSLEACKYLCVQLGVCRRFQYSKAKGCSIYQTPRPKKNPTFVAPGVTIGTSECQQRQQRQQRQQWQQWQR